MTAHEADDRNEAASVEIERTYLLNGMPDLPRGAEVLRIEQGYLPERTESAMKEAADDGDETAEGRLRRTMMPDGATVLEHVIKRGSGMVRTEKHLPITRERFEQLWPRTQGRRLMKTRYVVRTDDRDEASVWEIDEFGELDLVLAEVELPSPDARVTIPDWLQPHVVRDVTDEKQYCNYELALRLARESPKRQNVETSKRRNV